MQFWNDSCSSLKTKAKKVKLETERRIFFPGLREVIWLSECGRHSANSLEESKSAFQVVINTWKVISAARRARRARLLQAGGTGLDRVHQRGPTGDRELRDVIGR